MSRLVPLFELNDKVKFVEEFARTTMGDDPCHGWPHVERVAAYAERIAESIDNVDYDVLAIAILLHDIGRFYHTNQHHAIASSKVAEVFLRRINYDEEFIRKVSHAIIAHSFSLGVKAETVEAKILSDADKLDALGAIGIFRVIYTSGARKRGISESLRHFEEKILKLREKLYLPQSKKIAWELQKRVELYVAWLKDETSSLGYRV